MNMSLKISLITSTRSQLLRMANSWKADLVTTFGTLCSRCTVDPVNPEAQNDWSGGSVMTKLFMRSQQRCQRLYTQPELPTLSYQNHRLQFPAPFGSFSIVKDWEGPTRKGHISLPLSNADGWECSTSKFTNALWVWSPRSEEPQSYSHQDPA